MSLQVSGRNQRTSDANQVAINKDINKILDDVKKLKPSYRTLIDVTNLGFKQKLEEFRKKTFKRSHDLCIQLDQEYTKFEKDTRATLMQVVGTRDVKLHFLKEKMLETEEDFDFFVTSVIILWSEEWFKANVKNMTPEMESILRNVLSFTCPNPEPNPEPNGEPKPRTKPSLCVIS